MIKSEVISRLVATGQDNGAKALTVDTPMGPLIGGDPKLVAALAVAENLKTRAANVPDNVDLTREHFGDLRTALLQTVDRMDPVTRKVLAQHGIDNQLQHKLRALEIGHAVEGPGFWERAAAFVASIREKISK